MMFPGEMVILSIEEIRSILKIIDGLSMEESKLVKYQKIRDIDFEGYRLYDKMRDLVKKVDSD